NRMQPSKLKTQLLAISQTVAEDVDKFVSGVSSWVDKSLTMMGETYKKQTQRWSFIIGMIIAVVFNLDTLGIANHLYHDKEARETIAAFGAEFTQKMPKETFDKCTKAQGEEKEAKKTSECAVLYQLSQAVRLRENTFGKLPIGWPATEIKSLSLLAQLPL